MVSKYISGFGESFLLTCLANSLLVIAKDENAVLKNWMKGLTGHHWITHGIFVISMFLALGLIFSSLNTGRNWTEKTLISLVVAGVLLGGVILGGFMLLV